MTDDLLALCDGFVEITFLLLVQLSNIHPQRKKNKETWKSSTRWHCRTCNDLTPLPQMAFLFALKSPLNLKFFVVHRLLCFLFFPSFCFCSPEASAEPVPPSPGRWSQDLLSGLDRYGKEAFFSPPTKPQMQSYAKNYFFIIGKSIAPLSVASWGVTLTYLTQILSFKLHSLFDFAVWCLQWVKPSTDQWHPGSPG